MPDKAPPTAERKRLIITLQQTENADDDVARLHRLLAILHDYPGMDELSLVVSNGTKVFKLKMGQVRVTCCEELERRLAEIAGEDALKVERV